MIFSAMKSIDNLIRFSELDTDEDQFGRRSQCSATGGLLTVPGCVTYNPPSDDEQDNNQNGEINLLVPSPGYGIPVPPVVNDEEVKHGLNSSPHVTIVDDKRALVDTQVVEKEDKKDKKGGHGHGHSHEV